MRKLSDSNVTIFSVGCAERNHLYIKKEPVVGKHQEIHCGRFREQRQRSAFAMLAAFHLPHPSVIPSIP